jgi:hypothetical protein
MRRRSVTAWIFATLLLTAAPDYSDKWLVIEKTETKPAAGLVDTTPYSGLRPKLYIKVRHAPADQATANAKCEAAKAAGVQCYVKFAGQAAGSLAAIEAALKATSSKDIVYRMDLQLRGRKVPLVVRGKGARTKAQLNEWCEEGWVASGAATLFWAATPIRLPTMRARKGTCCTPLKQAPSPAGLTVLTQSCESPSCGGGCFKDTWAIIISDNHISQARAEYLHCHQDLSMPPDPAATCDRLETSNTRLSFTRTSNVRVTPCPDQTEAWEKIVKRVVTTTYRKGRFVTRARTIPHLEKLWGCE